MKRTLLLFLLSASLGLAQEVLHKTALLILPDEIECGTGGSHLFSGEMRFRWDEAAPLKVSLWRGENTEKPSRLMCGIEVFDEKGKRQEQWFFVSIPPPPEGEAIILPGERRQFECFTWNGYVKFPGPGNYYAIATFRWAWMGETNVVFTTTKRWFKVVEPPPKKSSL